MRDWESFYFDGIQKDWIECLQGRSNPPFAGLKRNTLDVPGVPGGYLQNTDTEPRVITQPIRFEVSDNADAQSLKDELVSWLVTEEAKTLVFPDEPERVYYAVVNNSIDDFDKFANERTGTIEFLCLDPYAYGIITGHSLRGAAMIPNEGTAPAQPVFDLRVTKESELIYIGNLSNMTLAGDRRAIYLGTEPSVEEDAQERKKLILHDTMQSTAGWTGATSVDSGIVTGTTGTDDNGFYVSDWGPEESDRETALKEIDDDINSRRDANVRSISDKRRELDDLKKKKKPTADDKNRIKELEREIKNLDAANAALDKERKQRRDTEIKGNTSWIGPSLKREFDRELDSFVMDIDIANRNERDANGDKIDGGVGLIEIYLRDINDNLVCKFAFGDSSDADAINSGMFATSGKRHPIRGKNLKGLNNFTGQLRITRDSGYFYPELTKINENGIRMQWIGPGQIIPSGTGSNPVKSIQVALRKWVGARRIWMRVKQIKVWDAIGTYEYPELEPVHKFHPGDEVHIDCGKGLVLLNGEERNDLVHLGTDFFTLVEGLNEMETSDNVDGAVTFPARYL